MYCLANWKTINSSQQVADLPEDAGYLLLASPCYKPQFSLFEVEEKNDLNESEKVSDEIYGLIESAKHFPPALAIGRDKVEEHIEDNFKDHPTKTEFLEVYKDILKDVLVNQRSSNYFICKAKDTESGYLYKDEFYWIVNYSNSERQVYWISRDYFVYQNHIDYFDVEEDFLINRFNI